MDLYGASMRVGFPLKLPRDHRVLVEPLCFWDCRGIPMATKLPGRLARDLHGTSGVLWDLHEIFMGIS